MPPLVLPGDKPLDSNEYHVLTEEDLKALVASDHPQAEFFAQVLERNRLVKEANFLTYFIKAETIALVVERKREQEETDAAAAEEAFELKFEKYIAAYADYKAQIDRLTELLITNSQNIQVLTNKL
jgi:hypothetical protein